MTLCALVSLWIIWNVCMFTRHFWKAWLFKRPTTSHSHPSVCLHMKFQDQGKQFCVMLIVLATECKAWILNIKYLYSLLILLFCDCLKAALWFYILPLSCFSVAFLDLKISIKKSAFMHHFFNVKSSKKFFLLSRYPFMLYWPELCHFSGGKPIY